MAIGASLDEFAEALQRRIESEYERRCHTESDRRGKPPGWRFLYGPRQTLAGSEVAFIGTNPGGSEPDLVNDGFSQENGSAFEIESWPDGKGRLQKPGKAKLQRRGLELFDLVGELPVRVLAGNLVPFRSPRWDKLERQSDAIAFGSKIWSCILARAQPQLIIAMGSEARRALIDILGVEETRTHWLDWGFNAARSGSCNLGHFVALPHLSRAPSLDSPPTRTGLVEALKTFRHGTAYSP